MRAPSGRRRRRRGRGWVRPGRGWRFWRECLGGQTCECRLCRRRRQCSPFLWLLQRRRRSWRCIVLGRSRRVYCLRGGGQCDIGHCGRGRGRFVRRSFGRISKDVRSFKCKNNEGEKNLPFLVQTSLPQYRRAPSIRRLLFHTLDPYDTRNEDRSDFARSDLYLQHGA